jgi:hypothetical protein
MLHVSSCLVKNMAGLGLNADDQCMYVFQSASDFAGCVVGAFVSLRLIFTLSAKVGATLLQSRIALIFDLRSLAWAFSFFV